MIKRDLDEESVVKTVIPMHKQEGKGHSKMSSNYLRVIKSINTSPYTSQLRQ